MAEGGFNNFNGMNEDGRKLQLNEIRWDELPEELLIEIAGFCDIRDIKGVRDWRGVAQDLGGDMTKIQLVESRAFFNKPDAHSCFLTLVKDVMKDEAHDKTLEWFLNCFEAHGLCRAADCINDNFEGIQQFVAENRRKNRKLPNFEIFTRTTSHTTQNGERTHPSRRSDRQNSTGSSSTNVSENSMDSSPVTPGSTYPFFGCNGYVPQEMVTDMLVDTVEPADPVATTFCGQNGFASSDMHTFMNCKAPRSSTTYMSKCETIPLLSDNQQELMDSTYTNAQRTDRNTLARPNNCDDIEMACTDNISVTSCEPQMGSMYSFSRYRQTSCPQKGSEIDRFPRRSWPEVIGHRHASAPSIGDVSKQNSSSVPDNFKCGPYKKYIQEVKILVAYVYRDKTEVMQGAVGLANCLKNNLFDVKIDQPNKELNTEIKDYYCKADFVLVCITPNFRKTIESKVQRKDHAYEICQWLKEGKPKKVAMVPVLCCAASERDVPGWMLSSWKEAHNNHRVYRWPDEYRNLFWFMLKPRVMLELSMQKQSQFQTR